MQSLLLLLLVLLPGSLTMMCQNEQGEYLPPDVIDCHVIPQSNATLTVSDVEANASQWAFNLFYRNETNGFRFNVSRSVTLTYWSYSVNATQKATTVSFDDATGGNDSVVVAADTLNKLTANYSAVLLVTRIARTGGGAAIVSTKTDAVSTALASNMYSVTAFHVVPSKGIAVALVKSSITVTYSVKPTSKLIRNLTAGSRTVLYDTLKYNCVYYHENSSTWSQFGCQATGRSGTNQLCSCNHTSSFAVMMTVRTVEVPYEIGIVSNVMESLSVLALLGTVGMLLWTRYHIPKERFLTQFGISLSLMLMHCAFLLGSIAFAVKNAGLCVFSTVVAQWFSLTAAMWMLNEGVMLFLKTRRDVLKFDPSAHNKKLLATGWILPLLYVIICIIAGFATNSYMDSAPPQSGAVFPYQRCWLSGGKHMMTLALVIPITLIVTTNAAILGVVIWKVRGMHSASSSLRSRAGSQETKNDFQITAHALLILMPMLGVPWILGLLVNIPEAALYFMAIHAVLNGVQGIVVATVVCFKNSELRLTAKRKFFNLGRDRSMSLDFS